VAGSGNDDEEWLNWIVRLASGVAIGTVQATIVTAGATRTAHVAWTIARPWQGQGYAVEAAAGLADWLTANDVDAIVAHVHPDHSASAGVARSIGLEPTDVMVDGEVVWR
jgi:RimJ/RimL family protein N-acetyltransferase